MPLMEVPRIEGKPLNSQKNPPFKMPKLCMKVPIFIFSSYTYANTYYNGVKHFPRIPLPGSNLKLAQSPASFPKGVTHAPLKPPGSHINGNFVAPKTYRLDRKSRVLPANSIFPLPKLFGYIVGIWVGSRAQSHLFLSNEEDTRMPQLL